jgi:hypothetical protein
MLSRPPGSISRSNASAASAKPSGSSTRCAAGGRPAKISRTQPASGAAAKASGRVTATTSCPPFTRTRAPSRTMREIGATAPGGSTPCQIGVTWKGRMASQRRSARRASPGFSSA